MADLQLNPNPENNQTVTMSIEQLMQMFDKMNKKQTQPEPVPISHELKVAEKLNYHNYTKWCKFMIITIDARHKLEHITKEPPALTDPIYEQGRQKDVIVLSWIISNIEPALVNQFLDYSTAWDLWKGIETL